ncbi:MAG: XRE family transcriptional regulator [Nakamurella sp.]
MVDPSAHQQSISAQQVEIYGERWADRFGRLLRAYEIPQAKLAAVIGVSAPMISQLISGQRVKISNPAVYGRIVELEKQLARPAMLSADPAARARVLAEITASNPSLTTRSTEKAVASATLTPDNEQDRLADERRIGLVVLARAASSAELLAVAGAARGAGAEDLAGLLAAAATLA